VFIRLIRQAWFDQFHPPAVNHHECAIADGDANDDSPSVVTRKSGYRRLPFHLGHFIFLALQLWGPDNGSLGNREAVEGVSRENFGMQGFAIQTRGLTRNFGPVRALDNLTLEVPAGSVFGFLGPNGAGKTTTIRLLLGLIEPTSGTASVLGFDTRTQSEEIRARSGALLEHSGLYERLSAEDNLRFFGRVARMPKPRLEERIRELLTHLGLWDRRKEAVVKWSRGMKQKLAIARPLLHNPPLVFLDEPTAGLDPVAAASLRDDLAALTSSQGATIFLTTHNMAEAEKLCHRVAVIREGKMLAVGSPAELRSRGGGQRAEINGRGFSEPVISALKQHASVSEVSLENGGLILTLRDGADVAPLVSLIVREGAEVQGVRTGQGSLEDVFLKLMEEDPE
jgi:ABC-2 type transport system ATP-binding protein